MRPEAIEIIHHPAPKAAAGDLLIMLPGYDMACGDFARHGLVQAVHDREWPVDIVAAQPDLGLYLDGTVAERIATEVVATARRSDARLWFLGVSLGAMGALLYARAYPGHVAGIVLLAPFLGSAGIIGEIEQAGGLVGWQPGDIRPSDPERQLLAWLKDHHAARPGPPALYLGYGRSDRFRRSASLLADHLPPDRVIGIDGGHDWETWRRLWHMMLERRPFAPAP